jgi:hypothetical protein
MKFKSLAVALTVAATPFISSAALAHDLQPFVCTPSGTPDGTAAFVTPAGRKGKNTYLALKTVAHGNSSVGATLINIDSGKTLTALTFTLTGTNTATDGPFAVITGHYSDGTPVSKVIPCSKAKVTRTLGSSKSLSIGPTELGITQTLLVDECDFELFPGVANNSTNIANVVINKNSVVLVTSTNQGCPLGTTHF